MGQQQSKDESLYQQVNYGNIEGIKSLCREGARLEWADREGKTPLILACMNPELCNVAKTLIELGADVNAYRRGRLAGTPLHHAAKRGLEETVKLLLSHGANALITNDDCQTPLDIARAKGFTNVVRVIESHICLFSGWLREFYGLGFLEVLAPQLVSRKVWVVILPCGSRNNRKPFKLELAIYSSVKDSQPRTVIALWKANLEEPRPNQPDPIAIIVDTSTIQRGRRRRRRSRPPTLRQTRYKFAAANETDRQQLQWFCDACKGIPQAMPPAFSQNNQAPIIQPTAPPTAEDLDFAMAINASVHSAMERPPHLDEHYSSQASASTGSNDYVGTSSHGCSGSPPKASSSHLAGHEAGPSGSSSQHAKIEDFNSPADQTTVADETIPSAPQFTSEIIEDSPVGYPSIDSSPISISADENITASQGLKKEDGSTCVVCLDAPVEGACVPCGHMAGCMSCLSEIRAKKWGCPVCRAKIDQVIKLYAV